MIRFRKAFDNSFTRKDALNGKPVKNVKVGEERNDNGDVLLSYPMVFRPWFARLARRIGMGDSSAQEKKLQLDELGTAVWDMIDGKRSVQQLIKIFASKYQLHPREAEVSITLFLRDLGKRGIIGLN
jgi:hypothetical protein